jgi:hypothetical protein
MRLRTSLATLAVLVLTATSCSGGDDPGADGPGPTASGSASGSPSGGETGAEPVVDSEPVEPCDLDPLAAGLYYDTDDLMGGEVVTDPPPGVVRTESHLPGINIISSEASWPEGRYLAAHLELDAWGYVHDERFSLARSPRAVYALGDRWIAQHD